MRKTMMAAAAAALFLSTIASAEDYPSHAIRLIVPFAAGGSTDAQARIVADYLSRELGQTMVVVNVGGAGGSIGATQAAKSTPDGYTLVTATPSLVINPYIQKDIGYDPLRDFEPVVQVATSPLVVVVPKNSKINSIKDLLDMAKAHPGTVKYGSAGVGSSTHLSTALFAAMADVDMVHVPYRGAGPAILDLIAGRIDVQFENAASVVGQINGGELKAIAVGSARRSTIFPNLPTVGETVKGYESTSWFGLLAPSKTPAAVVTRINAAVNKALADPTVQKQLDTLGVERGGGSNAQFEEFIKTRVTEMKTISKAANLTPQ